MSYFKGKLHQIRFRLELRPKPCWGHRHSTSQILKGREVRGRVGDGKGKEKGGGMKGGELGWKAREDKRGRGKEGKMGGKGGKEKERGPLPHFVKPPPSY